MFITFEGLDFSGKSTQASLLVDALNHPSPPSRPPFPDVLFIREPGGTTISERIRTLLLDRRALEMAEAAELFLFAASRAQLVREVIVPALARLAVVVCDRFTDSTTAYQGYGRGIDLETVNRINRLATAGLKPDLTLLIDIPLDVMRRRASAAGTVEDRMESAGGEFYERVRQGYHALASAEPARVRVIDGTASPATVHDEVRAAVGAALAVTLSSALR
jgi:dTMP kinase